MFDLNTWVSNALPNSTILDKNRSIFDTCSRKFPEIIVMKKYNPTDPSLLYLLFQLYDEYFFENMLQKILDSRNIQLDLSFSKRMTRAAGRTRWSVFKTRETPTKIKASIIISTHIFSRIYPEANETILVENLTCKTRLDALQRVFEHELTHLTEFLIWNKSSCKKTQFKTIAHNFFGHIDISQNKKAQREQIIKKFNIHVGDYVQFQFKQQAMQGLVHRMTHRATVLVANDKGITISNGKHYHKFYVPLQQLKKVEKSN
jgi:hypothetical protein